MDDAVKSRSLWAILRETASEWSDDNASRLSAALAFYTLLSLAPLLVLAVFVVGLAYGEDAARGHIAAELPRVVGQSRAAVGSARSSASA